MAHDGYHVVRTMLVDLLLLLKGCVRELMGLS